MVYECLQCQMPQRHGAVTCPRCAARFDGPVPADAVVPDAPSPTTPLMPAPDLAQGHAAPQPQWVMPTIPAMHDAAPIQVIRPLSRPLMIAGAAILLIALLSGGYALLSSTQTPPAPVDMPTVTAPAATPAAPPPATLTPVILPSVSPSGVANASSQAAPIGHWMSKTFDFYEFDPNGSGTRGNIESHKPAQMFSWTVEKNQLILSLNQGGTDKIPFSYGPGGSVLYLRQPSGHYLELTRQS